MAGRLCLISAKSNLPLKGKAESLANGVSPSLFSWDCRPPLAAIIKGMQAARLTPLYLLFSPQTPFGQFQLFLDRLRMSRTGRFLIFNRFFGVKKLIDILSYPC